MTTHVKGTVNFCFNTADNLYHINGLGLDCTALIYEGNLLATYYNSEFKSTNFFYADILQKVGDVGKCAFMELIEACTKQNNINSATLKFYNNEVDIDINN